MDHVPTSSGRGRSCIYRVVRVSGTIRKVEEEAISQAKQLIVAAKEEAGTDSAIFESGQGQGPSTRKRMELNVADSSEDESMSDSEDP
jgi:ribonuclease P/MRP protein subunit POP5